MKLVNIWCNNQKYKQLLLSKNTYAVIKKDNDWTPLQSK